MNPGTTVKITGSVWRGRTGTVIEPTPNDVAKWPEYARVKLDDTITDVPPQLIEREQLEAFQRAGQLGLFGGAP